jgi:TRAP-type C4-dicarboxylate transport system permease small subunit
MLGDLLKDSGLKALNFKFEDAKLADVLSGLLNIAIYLAIFMTFFWLVWGAFQYILASGKKEELAKARSRITWALIGLMVVITAYLITTYAAEIFPPVNKGDLPF